MKCEFYQIHSLCFRFYMILEVGEDLNFGDK